MTRNTRHWSSSTRITATETREQDGADTVLEAAAGPVTLPPVGRVAARLRRHAYRRSKSTPAAWWSAKQYQKPRWHPVIAWLRWRSHWPSAQPSAFDPALYEPASETMNLKTDPLLRLAAAALLLAASSSALAQGSSSNMSFQFVSSTVPPGSGASCRANDPCSLQDIANSLAEVGKGDADGPATKANPYTVYLLEAGTYKVPLSLLQGRAVAPLYGGFPPGFAGYTSFTDASFPGALATRDLKNNVTVLSGDLNNNGIVDAGDAASVVTLTSRLAGTLLDGFHIEGGLESAVKVDGGRPTLRNVVIRGNAGHGLHITGGATSSLSNVLIYGNGGTGLVVEGSAPTATNLTIASNGKASTAVGGLSCTGTGESCGTYRNTIIWGNAGEDVKVSSESSVLPNPTFHHSLMQGCKAGGTWNPACGVDGSNNLADADPQFVDAPLCTAVPNRVGNYRLQTGSPALDVGDNTATSRPKDLDGRDRVQAGTIDLGAYEGGVVVPPVDGACGTANGEATATAPTSCSLCETGTASAVTGTDDAWGWSCAGTGTGSTATCSAPYAMPTITLTADPTRITVGGTGSTVTGSSTSGVKPELTSTTTDVCSVSPTAGGPMATTVTATGLSAGTCTIKATLAGTGDTGEFRYLAADDETVNITVAKGAQTITGFAAGKSTLKVGEMTTLSATGGASGNEVEFDTLDPESCFVSGNMVTALAAGSCVVLVNQSGNDSYDAATTKTLRITINKAAQLISGFSANPASIKVGGMATLSASGGASGNAVSFRTTTGDVCSVSGAMVTGLSAGNCALIASQAGNADFDAADEVSLTVPVAKAAQLISGFAVSPSSLKVGQTGQLSAFGGASGKPVVFASTTADTCSVSGSTVTALAVGTCTVTANQAGSADFDAAETATLNIGIEAAEVATGPALTLDMNDLDFGTGYLLRFRDIGVETTSEAEVVTLSNTGTAPLSISSIVTTGDFRHTTTCGSTVAPGARCTISIVFSPKAVGTRTGETRIVSNAVTSPDRISLSGTGKGLKPAMKTNVSRFDFGRVKVGAASREQTLVITSTGSGPLEIRSIRVSGDYSGSHNCPRWLDAGKSCQVTGSFKPKAVGTRPGSVSILTSVSNTATEVSLTGTGF